MRIITKKIKLPTILLILLSMLIVCSSCCISCLIANSDLSSISNGNYNSWKNVTTIKSNYKEVKIAPINGGQIVSYSYNNENITAPVFIPEQLIEIKNVSKKIKFINNTISQIQKPDSVYYSNSLRSKDKLQFSQKFRMNLNNGDVFVTQYIKNVESISQEIYLTNRTFLKYGGFIIIPTSIISKLTGRWKLLDNTKDNINNDSVKIFNDKLIMQITKNTPNIGLDSTADWFAYIWKDMLFLKKSFFGKKTKYATPLTINVINNKSYFSVVIPKVILNLPPTQEVATAQKWTIIKLDRTVTSYEEAIDAFNSYHINLILNR